MTIKKIISIYYFVRIRSEFNRNVSFG